MQCLNLTKNILQICMWISTNIMTRNDFLTRGSASVFEQYSKRLQLDLIVLLARSTFELRPTMTSCDFLETSKS